MEDFSKYAHSPAHLAVARRDHAALRRIVAGLPQLAKASEVTSEAESLEAQLRAGAVSAVIDRRDVPGRETPLHLAVRLQDPISAEILVAAGADWWLQNENGWSAVQEVVCAREQTIAMIISRHRSPRAWAKWCWKLPRVVASASRIMDFYMEITFHFESSVIPFISRIAPSDTYRIWKRGSNLRVDTTLAGSDGFRIQRSDRTFLFLGEGYSSDDGKISLPPGSLILLAHEQKEVENVLEGAGTQPTEAEVAHKVALMMSRTGVYRPGIDVTKAELVPHLNWMRQERTEMVGNWKAKVYDMLHVTASVRSRRVPDAKTNKELLAIDEEMITNGAENDDYEDVLTAEERMQFGSALRMGNEENEVLEYQGNSSGGSCERREANGAVKGKKSWFGWNKKGLKTGSNDTKDSKLKSGSKLGPEDVNHKGKNQRSDFSMEDVGDVKKVKEKGGAKKKKKEKEKKKKKGGTDEAKHESEYKIGVRPVLWLTTDFPLKTDEFLPLLDIFTKKVKDFRRLRDLLTTKLPTGTFPVKLAIPIVPTIRVLVTFTKFDELQPVEEFSTPPSSPVFHDAKSKESESSTSWISWMKGSRIFQSSDNDRNRYKDEVDPFLIPSDYTWVDANEQKRRMKAKKAEKRKNEKRAAAKAGDSGSRSNQDAEE